MRVKTIFDKIPNSKICYKDEDSLGMSWMHTVHEQLLDCVFVADESNNIAKLKRQQNNNTNGKKINERVYWILHSIELGDERPKVKISKTLFKILSFFNLCEEV